MFGSTKRRLCSHNKRITQRYSCWLLGKFDLMVDGVRPVFALLCRVNFQAYVQPFPNYYVLGPNIRYYLAHGVRSVFPSFSAIFNRKMQKMPLFSCILIRNEGKTVRGMYEEGNGHGPGSDLDAMKAYLMAQIMYDPSLDDDTLISNFLNAYYGDEVAPFVPIPESWSICYCFQPLEWVHFFRCRRFLGVGAALHGHDAWLHRGHQLLHA
jgi:hypothetical protein